MTFFSIHGYMFVSVITYTTAALLNPLPEPHAEAFAWWKTQQHCFYIALTLEHRLPPESLYKISIYTQHICPDDHQEENMINVERSLSHTLHLTVNSYYSLPTESCKVKSFNKL